jgi:hypothetical protein
MGTSYNTTIVRDGLVLHLDPANVKSYPGTGPTWSDISPSKTNATLLNTTYNSNNSGGVFDLNGAGAYATSTNSSISGNQPLL